MPILIALLIGSLANYSSSLFGDCRYCIDITSILPLLIFTLLPRANTEYNNHSRIWLGYFAASSFTLPMGAGVFFGETAYAFALGSVAWISTIIIQGYLWGWITHTTGKLLTNSSRLLQHITGYLFFITSTLLLLNLPFIGIIMWVHPFTLPTSVLLPQTGLYGIFVIASLAYLIIVSNQITTRTIKLLSYVALSFSVTIAFIQGYTKNDNSTTTHQAIVHGKNISAANLFSDRRNLQARLAEITLAITSTQADIILFPENAIGQLQQDAMQENELLAALLQISKHWPEKVLLLGAELRGEQGFENTSLQIRNGKIESIHLARSGVPLSMWKPLESGPDSMHQHWWETGVVQIDEINALYLVCYEQYLTYPALFSYGSDKPIDVILAPANSWWANQTGLDSLQALYAKAWGRILSVPVIRASAY